MMMHNTTMERTSASCSCSGRLDGSSMHNIPLSRRVAAPVVPLRQLSAARSSKRRHMYHMQCRAASSDEPAKTTNVEAEKSQMVNNELVLLLFQLDCDTQLQRALNYENFDAAGNIRARRQKVDEALAALQEGKGQGGKSKQAEITDVAAEGLRVRSELQKAVEEERYADAATLRDRLKELEAASAAAQALAAEWVMDAVQPAFRLGQRVMHKTLGYRGVVCGWDEVCCEADEWQAVADVSSLKAGVAQPFYHILVDMRDWPSARFEAPVAYVAEELLDAPQEPATWVDVHGRDEFQHPYSYLLFLGVDGAGDLLPVQQLRDKYAVARRDVYAPGEEEAAEEEEEEEDNGGQDELPPPTGGPTP